MWFEGGWWGVWLGFCWVVGGKVGDGGEGDEFEVLVGMRG